MERQFFGFAYQKLFCKENNLKEDKVYTGKFDAYGKLPIQIKTYKNKGELMMADPFRYINASTFILVIANRDDTKVISEKCLLIEKDKWETFLKDNDFVNRANYCKQVLSSVTNSREDDARFTELMKKEKSARKNSIINMQSKRDHKHQKRVQWSIPNRHLEKFYSLFKSIDKKDLPNYN